MLVKTTDEQTLLHVLTASCAHYRAAALNIAQGSIWQNNIWLLLKAPT